MPTSLAPLFLSPFIFARKFSRPRALILNRSSVRLHGNERLRNFDLERASKLFASCNTVVELRLKILSGIILRHENDGFADSYLRS